MTFQVHVHVRVRPLAEDDAAEAAREVTRAAGAAGRPGAEALASFHLSLDVPERGGETTKKRGAGGFRGVLDTDASNRAVFESAVAPLVGRAAGGGTATVVCYGHSGTGKTHTILGCGPGGEDGLYHLAAARLLEAARAAEPGAFLQVRFAEVYNNRVFDLLAGGVECEVRDNGAGVALIRSPVEKHADGRVSVRPLRSETVRSAEAVSAAVAGGQSLRRVGPSTVHDRSSRSHALLEMEVVTDALLAARAATLRAESELVPAGHARDTAVILSMQAAGRFLRLPDGRLAQNPKFTLDPALAGRVASTQAAFEEAEGRLLAARRREDECLAALAPRGVGGTLCFVDLAGAEHAAVQGARGAKTAEQRREARAINTSLLALKDCVRGLAAGSTHVPFRNSRLTVLLRRHLEQRQLTAVIATVSPAVRHARRTLNTLYYASLMAGREPLPGNRAAPNDDDRRRGLRAAMRRRAAAVAAAGAAAPDPCG